MSGILHRLLHLRNREYDNVLSVQELIYRLNEEDYLSHLQGLGSKSIPTVSVSDLVYCSHRAYLSRRYPLVHAANNMYNSSGSLGRLVHLGLETLLKRYWDVETEVHVEKIVTLDDGRAVKVVGRIDALRRIEDTIVVYEFKSSRGDHELPLEQHRLQLQIYMNIVGSTLGILFYINPDRIAEYTITEPLSDEKLKQLVMETLADERHPRYEWECRYCPFSMMCMYKRINHYPKR